MIIPEFCWGAIATLRPLASKVFYDSETGDAKDSFDATANLPSRSHPSGVQAFQFPA